MVTSSPAAIERQAKTLTPWRIIVGVAGVVQVAAGGR